MNLKSGGGLKGGCIQSAEIHKTLWWYGLLLGKAEKNRWVAGRYDTDKSVSIVDLGSGGGGRGCIRSAEIEEALG